MCVKVIYAFVTAGPPESLDMYKSLHVSIPYCLLFSIP
jgi:hypothetical protein